MRWPVTEGEPIGHREWCLTLVIAGQGAYETRLSIERRVGRLLANLSVAAALADLQQRLDRASVTSGSLPARVLRSVVRWCSDTRRKRCRRGA